jgi:hypothetical protein
MPRERSVRMIASALRPGERPGLLALIHLLLPHDRAGTSLLRDGLFLVASEVTAQVAIRTPTITITCAAGQRANAGEATPR